MSQSVIALFVGRIHLTAAIVPRRRILVSSIFYVNSTVSNDSRPQRDRHPGFKFNSCIETENPRILRQGPTIARYLILFGLINLNHLADRDINAALPFSHTTIVLYSSD